MRYGVPYKGSKNAIAKKIVAFLPSAPVLIDICAGGCAVTHAALEACEGLAPKWERIIANDVDPMPLRLFQDAIAGRYTPETEKRWITREDFHRLKNRDPYVRYCWSFANNGQDYMYADEVEPWKRALHHAYVLQDYSLLEEIVGPVPREGLREYLRGALRASGKTVADVDRHLGTNGMTGHYFGRSQLMFLQKLNRSRNPESLKELVSLQSLQRLQRLQGLQGLDAHHRLVVRCGDYASVDIPPGAVVYADIPYGDTNCGVYGGFDHARFFDWAAAQAAPVYISSYYVADPRFVCVWQTQKRQNSAAGGHGKTVTEKIYTQRRDAP